jgi:hypothetical protein
MLKKVAIIILCICHAWLAGAQESLFGTDKEESKPHYGFVFNINAGVDKPIGVMAKRFGTSYRLGPSLTYKTTSNWIFGVRLDFIVGSNIKDDSLMINIRDRYSGAFNGKTVEMINVDGNRIGVPFYQRGYLLGGQVGKIFNLRKSRPDDGIMALTTIGFVQHRINIFLRDKDIPQLKSEYLKGYDRLTNGWFIDEYIGYNMYSKSGLWNMNFGIDAMFGFTKGRREYQFDLGRADNAARLDVLLGARIGWMIPVFKRAGEEIVFE